MSLSRVSIQFGRWLESELAAELYADDVIDGQGLPIASCPLCFPEDADRVDIPHSVSESDTTFDGERHDQRETGPEGIPPGSFFQ